MLLGGRCLAGPSEGNRGPIAVGLYSVNGYGD